ncbi:DUF11 domain-containing protein [Candidatus Saccharibacteria bacterium]|nr:DUF11 domain-containing protein [Candidatus Saccharibacteria bacterium]
MNKVYKTILSVAAAAIVGGATLVPANVLAWGDSAGGRTVYTIEQINEGALGDTITFNSITNGKIGDERNFVGAKLSGTTSVKDNEISVEDGKTYTVRLYVHNNSPLGVDKTAENVTVNFALPTTVGKSHTVVGYINASNAMPNRYWDEVKFVSDDNFYLEYVDGSARYTNAKLGTVALPNEVITSGAKIGYEGLDGKIPGCFAYDGEVTIEVTVHKAASAKLSKTVRLKGTKEWKESVDAKIGDEVEYQIEYKNLTSETVSNVMIRDILPKNMEYVKDSTYLYNANYQSGVQVVENTVTTTGINIGSYTMNGNAYVRFTAKVINKTLACGDNQLVNWANVTVNSEVAGKDDASVMVNRVCETPEPEPEDPEPELPITGATDIVAGALGAGSIVTMLGYAIASRKK